MKVEQNPIIESFSTLFTTVAEKTNAVVSIGMITSPWWVFYLKDVSAIAALFAPILGCIYLLMQIGFKLWDRSRKED